MKKSSAFSVFNSKKKNPSPHGRPPSGHEERKLSGHEERKLATLQRAVSAQSVDKGESTSRGKKILNALKNSSIRESMRFSNKKPRPAAMSIADSPFNGSDGLSLDQLKIDSADRLKIKAKKKGKSPKLEDTPLTRKQSPRLKKQERDDTAPLPSKKRSSQTSTTSLRQKLQSPNQAFNTSLMSTDEDSSRSNKGDSGQKKKRRSVEAVDQGSAKKKRRTEKGAKAVKSWKSVRSDFPYMYDSSQEASKLFECVIHPVKTERFFSELWEKKPLLVKRHTPDYNKGWFTTAEFDKILRQDNIQWGVNLDATSFIDDKRETHNLSGKAHAPVVWDMYQAGCSMRLLNPQTYSRNVWKVLSVLQEYFGCCVGANVYLTPPGTQGFAPHYDDIEAFIIQLEGKKHWRLYNPRNEEEVLPQTSSTNFSASDVGEPILDVELEAGDMLYFPRGTIHQGNATDQHSLHITMSCYQMNTWGDLLKKMLPAAIDLAVAENADFRSGLPRDYLNYMGVVHSEKELPSRQNFMDRIQGLMQNLVEHCLPLDSSCDQMGRQLMHDALPPVLSEAEKMCSVHSAGEKWDAGQNRVMGVSEMTPNTAVKIIRRGALRLLTEDDTVRIYYSVDNARVYRASGPHYMEISPEMAPAVEHLINAYPEYTVVETLPMENLSEQLNVASLLYEKGLLITSEPLETTFDEGEDTGDDL